MPKRNAKSAGWRNQCLGRAECRINRRHMQGGFVFGEFEAKGKAQNQVRGKGNRESACRRRIKSHACLHNRKVFPDWIYAKRCKRE